MSSSFHTSGFCDFYRIRPFLNGHIENGKARARLTGGDRSVEGRDDSEEGF